MKGYLGHTLVSEVTVVEMTVVANAPVLKYKPRRDSISRLQAIEVMAIIRLHGHQLESSLANESSDTHFESAIG
jgi:hypothetical protein